MAKQKPGVYDRVLECAKDEFLSKGFLDASLRAIAQEAGTSTCSIYTRFGDKEGLFRAIVEPVVDQFKATLSEKDMQILELRMSGDTLEEIAEKLGYKNHSGVLKRIRKIGQAYEAYTGVDYGFENDKITG